MASAIRQQVLLQRRMNSQNHLFWGFGLGMGRLSGCYHDRLMKYLRSHPGPSVMA